MYKINGNDIDVYYVIRRGFTNDVILRNYTKDEVKCLGCFKSENKAVEKRNEVKRIIEFIGGEVSEDEI